jgi:UDP-2,3-diacylglucosamine pyrophosphatase LpxH
MHERLREALLEIARNRDAKLRLVACYNNEQFGMPDDKAIQIFLPDMHLLSKARRTVYSYGLNHEGMLEDVLTALIQLKTQAAPDESIVIFHIGDYLDLWRESLNPADPDVARRIKQDHLQLCGLLEDPRLNAHFLLGNHDFDLYQLAAYNNWERRFFIPAEAPGLVILHGDYFDPVERELPEDLRDIGVYLFGKAHQAGSAVLSKMADRAHEYNKEQDFTKAIRFKEGLAPLGAVQPGDANTGADFNVQKEQNTVNGGLLFLDKACAECVGANQSNGTALKTAIIGHTHHARIAVCPMPGGGQFTLIDCGAWIENCVDADGSDAFPNAQITALSANQARIYQLDLPGSN